jgi:hypothetical protein
MEFPDRDYYLTALWLIMPSENSQADINSQRARVKAKRKILAVFMESPLYFTIPLHRRLEFLNFFSQQAVYERISEHNPQVVSPPAAEQPQDQRKK